MKLNRITVPMVAVLLMGLSSCKEEKKKQAIDNNKEIESALDIKNLDTTVKPADDFYKYVNGTWLATEQIPGDRSSWGSFQALAQKTDEDALGILKQAMNDDPDLRTIKIVPGSDQEKAVFLYETIVDTVTRQEQGIEPIRPILNSIEKIKNIQDLQAYLIEMEPKGPSALFGFGVGADAKDSNMNIGYISPGGLGLPEKDYYTKEDEKSVEIREKYVNHVSRMLQFIGESQDDAIKDAKSVLAFETELAKAQMDKEERRNPEKRYNPTSISDLQKMVTNIEWNEYFQGLGISEIDTVVVTDPGYFKALDKVLTIGNISTWQTYLRWHTIDNAANKLSPEIEKANWDFFSKELNGTKEQRPLEERALQTLNWSIGEALGKLYVDQKFPPAAKEKAEKMIENVILAYENRIQQLDWMSEQTKKQAIEKLKATKIKVGYPDTWKDYSDLEVMDPENGGSYYQNMLNVSEWNFKDQIGDLGKPVDKSEWFMAPQIVNAYFNPSYNEIVFPAAILQPPYYNYKADDAVNYGGMGAVIGHEISHSFDDQGAKFDKDGNLKNWWTESDYERFKELGEALARQYDSLEVLPNVNVNGAFTLGENIGDLGGLNAAYDALQMSLEKNGRPSEIDGLTPEQRFFMNWATVWRTLSTDEYLNNQVKTDPHSPGMFRAIQPLRNIDAFYEAFNIQEGDAMFLPPDERVRIW
ncbi:M13 family metallopeptidase [Aegicerativicinus sediminis]